MDLGIRGKVALVTGASQGLGRAAAAALAAEGTHVVLTARRREVLEQVAAAMRASGSQADVCVADVTKLFDLEQLAADCEKRGFFADILVVNAGGPPPGATASFTPEDWRSAAELLLYPVVELTRLFVPAMRRRRWGRVVVIGSVSVRQPIDNLVLSNSFRAAVSGYLKTLAGEVAADGITVNLVCPGYTSTERVTEVIEANARRDGVTAEAARQALLAQIPAGRMATPEEVGAAIAFLCSRQAASITGTAIVIDGGLVRAH